MQHFLQFAASKKGQCAGKFSSINFHRALSPLSHAVFLDPNPPPC
jgi:hypothetical protein